MGKLSHREANTLAQVSSWRATRLLPSELHSLHLLNSNKVKKVKVLVTRSCPTLCDPMDCSPSGSSVHGILQARILEWVAIPFSRDLPTPGIELRSPALQADSLPSEPLGKPESSLNGGLEEAMRPPGRKKMPDAARNNYCSGRVGWYPLPFPCYR